MSRHRLLHVALALVVALSAGLFTGVSPSAASSVAAVSGTSDLLGIGCTSEPYCLAGGIDRATVTTPSATPVVATATGGTPGAAQTVPGLFDVLGVSCESATICFAVGAQVNGSTAVGAISQITNGTPGSAVTVAGTTALRGVSCVPATTSCVAVGDSATHGSSAVVAITNNTVGATQTVGGIVALSGVGCMSTTSCAAVGEVLGTAPDGSGNRGGVVAITNGQAGGVQSVGNSSVLYGIGCAVGTTACVAAGAVLVSQSQGEGVVVPVSNGSAGGAQSVPGTYDLYGAACVSATSCWVVGNNNFGTDAANEQGVVVSVSNGSPGTIEQVAGTKVLQAVSCENASTCVAAGHQQSGTDNSASDTGEIVLIGSGGGAVHGPFFKRNKADALADLSDAVEGAKTYCTPAALGFAGFGAGALLIALPGAQVAGSVLAAAGAVTASTTSPFCVAVLKRMASDFKRYKDPPSPSYDVLASPAPIAAVKTPSCGRWSGTAYKVCRALSAAEKKWAEAEETVASVDEALSTTMNRESGAVAAGDQSAATRQDNHLSDLEKQEHSALAAVASAGKSVAQVLKAHGIGYQLSKDRSSKVISAVKQWLPKHTGVSSTSVAQATGGNPFQPGAIDILKALANGS